MLGVLCAVFTLISVALFAMLMAERAGVGDNGGASPEPSGAGLPDPIAASAGTDELRFELQSLQQQLTETKEELAEANKRVEELQNASSNEAAKLLEAELRDTIASLTAKVSEKQREIDAVNDKIAAYDSISDLDVGAQAETVTKLFSTLAGGAPNRVLEREVTPEGGGEPVRETYEQYPVVALYYEDLTTGYSVAYNADRRIYSASLIKAPYIYSVLRDVSDFEAGKLAFESDDPEAKNPNLDENGDIIYAEGEEKYDLSRVWTFDKEKMMKEGTGKIQEMENGVQMTYLELIQYAIVYSDNIAFAELREVFGYTSFYKQAAALGVGYPDGFMYNTAADYGKFLRAIYDFTETDDKYAAVLKEAMLSANYRILIPFAVSPKAVAHKYGWDIDSYHDMGIVYDEHPYVMVIMTDMDTVDDDENEFIRSVARSVDKLHTGFYNGINKSLLDRYKDALAALEAQATAAAEAGSQ